MRILIVLVAGVLAVAMAPAAPADAQQVKIETTRKPTEREARIVPPPLHYETTRPPDADFYPRGTRVEHDPAFIEPFAGSYQNSTGSGRYGLSGWTAPNPPVGAEATNWKEVNGWFALGFSVTWDGPPARGAPAQRPR
jgi:hypothetical protein